jgi:GT2 family glycosyltransferase
MPYYKENQSHFAYLILSYKSDDMTLDLVNKIREFDSKSTIVVVDNSKENKLLELKLSSIGNTYFISSGENLGYAKGNNLGLEYLSKRGDINYVFICNPDIDVNKASINLMKSAIYNNQGIAVLGASMHDSESNYQISHWKSKTLIQDIFGDFSFVRFFSRDFNKSSKKDVQLELIECDVVTGAFFLADLDILRSIDYFDERTFLYCEERILAKRLDNIGAKRFILNEATFRHEGSSTISMKFASRLKRHLLLIKSRRIYYRYYTNQKNLFIYSLSTPFSILEKVILDAIIYIFKMFKK